MLNRQKHELVMKQILAEIYQDSVLAPSLAFKGGTYLYLFHNLNRFSTDLDFNLVKQDLDHQRLNQLLLKYLKIDEFHSKYYTWFWSGRYEKNNPKIKVEISKRDYPDKYETVDFYGLKVKAMAKDCVFAHKLCAISDRKELQNRDLFDAYFMFKQNFEINKEIIQIRTGKTLQEYFKFLIEYITQNIDSKNSILEGLGEVLDSKQKNWVKENLLNSLLFELRMRAG